MTKQDAIEKLESTVSKVHGLPANVWQDLQEKMLQLLEKARKIDLNKAKVPISINAKI